MTDQGIDQPALGDRHQVAHARLDQVLDRRVRQHLFDQMPKHIQIDQRPHTGIAELVFHFPCRVQRVGVDHYQTGTQGTEYGNRVLQDVGHLHGDTVTRLQIGMLLQPGRKSGGVPIQFGITEGHAQVAEGRTLGKALTGALEHIHHRAVVAHVQGIAHARRALVVPKLGLHCCCPLGLFNGCPANLAACPEQANTPHAQIRVVNCPACTAGMGSP